MFFAVVVMVVVVVRCGSSHICVELFVYGLFTCFFDIVVVAVAFL